MTGSGNLPTTGKVPVRSGADVATQSGGNEQSPASPWMSQTRDIVTHSADNPSAVAQGLTGLDTSEIGVLEDTMTQVTDRDLDPDEDDAWDPDFDDPLSLDAVLARVPGVELSRRLQEHLADAGDGAGVELRETLVQLVFGPDAAHDYGAVFDFDPLDLLTAVGADVGTLLAFSPNGEDYGAFGLARVTLGERGCLLSWYSGEDDSREWFTDSWSPAAARTPYLKALSDAFAGLDEEHGVIDAGGDATIAGFACAADLLDQRWRRRRRLTWTRWLERWLDRYRHDGGALAAELTDYGESLVRAAEVGDVVYFVTELLRRGDHVLARFGARAEPVEERRLLVLLSWLDDAGALEVRDRAREEAQAEWQRRGAARAGRTPPRPRTWNRIALPPPRTDWIYVVTASFEKLWDRLPAAGAVRASHAYIGDDFVANRALAEASGRPWFILSPQHGLLAPDARVTPDELTFSAVDREAFLARVEAQARALGVGGRPWEVLGHRGWKRSLASGAPASC